MASTTTMNAWVEELVRSLLSAQILPNKTRKHIDNFNRSIRYHNYGRTNQFEVQERLIGLEEKFQVLNHDDLSDTLRERRLLLQKHQERWIPDALDFLLGLSANSLSGNVLEELAGLDRSVPQLPTLKWSDIEVDEPINRSDRMWRQPEFINFSSDEDEAVESSAATSPSSQKQRTSVKETVEHANLPENLFDQDSRLDLATRFQAALLHRGDAKEITISEIQAIRETLFMVQGLPTDLFVQEGSVTTVSRRYRLSHLCDTNLVSILSPAIEIGNSTRFVNKWLIKPEKLAIMQALQDCVRGVLAKFDQAITQMHARLSSQASCIASLLHVVKDIRIHAQPIQALQEFLHRIRDEDAVGCLEFLHGLLCKYDACDGREVFTTFLQLFRAVIKTYSRLVEHWVLGGILNDADSLFFVHRAPEQSSDSSLWHTWYTCSSKGPNRPPSFLVDQSSCIFAAGKTQAFLRQLAKTVIAEKTGMGLVDVLDLVYADIESSMMPFAHHLNASLSRWVNKNLAISTSKLEHILQHQCGLSSTLDAFEHLYLAKDAIATHSIDSKIFAQIDQGLTSWSDRFLVSDFLEEAFKDIHSIDHDRLIIHADPIPAKDMKTARQSVKILESLAIDYLLPWPIANILLPDSLASYRRIALLLSQVRRAKHILERHVLPALQPTTSPSSSIRVSAGRLLRPVRSAEGTFLTLHAFITTLYTHLTTCVINPLTIHFRQNLTGTIDEMINIHKSYLTALEYACLTAKNLKLLKDTTITILDLCLSFNFYISTSRDFDVDKLKKIRGQARKHIDLLVTGLRGVSRSTSSTSEASELLELFANRLESCSFKA